MKISNGFGPRMDLCRAPAEILLSDEDSPITINFSDLSVSQFLIHSIWAMLILYSTV